MTDGATIQFNELLRPHKYGFDALTKARLVQPLYRKRFVKQYLPAITQRTKWFKPTKPLKQNDLVLVIDADYQRNSYPKSRILEAPIS